MRVIERVLESRRWSDLGYWTKEVAVTAKENRNKKQDRKPASADV